tara:strand:- start:230 stop:397 length:168 start_codon:yes stop_codon:yes gene_type:complete
MGEVYVMLKEDLVAVTNNPKKWLEEHNLSRHHRFQDQLEDFEIIKTKVSVFEEKK